MIYEVRTYTLKPGTVPQYEKNFAEALPYREKFSKLGGFWHSEIGPLNQVVHIWPYKDLKEREEVRAAAAKDSHWPPAGNDLILDMNSEIFQPTPFMKDLPTGAIGKLYEMRTYTYQPGAIPEVIKLWAEVVPHRVQFSPLAACMYSELGGLNRWMHVWPYKDLNERERVRGEAGKTGQWPAKTRHLMIRQENKIMIPASFSPLH